MTDVHFSKETLEFPLLLSSLSQQAKITSTQEIIQTLHPHHEIQSLLADITILTEYIQLYQETGMTFTSEELSDMKNLFSALDLEGFILSPEEALIFRQLLTLLENNIPLFTYVQSHQENFPSLYALCATMEYLPELRKTFDLILSSRGEINETASENLIHIREKKHTLRKLIQQKLENFIHNDKVTEFLQDNFVTVKDGRFVLPIKTSLKNVFQREYQAILHSYSKSGETVYMEPSFIIEANNEVLEIDELETQEMIRLMAEITHLLRQYTKHLLAAYEVFPLWEWLHIRFLFWKTNQCTLPKITDKPMVHIIGARHPFLGKHAVPVDILLENCQALIMSGPNAGGKTVALKTAGLFTLMSLCGIPLPASEATIGFFQQVYAEIGDEQSLEKQLSSFTGQITSLQSIWEKANSRTLVLIDEIANNTDPREGEALAKAYIQALLAKGAFVIITTHYNGLKQLAHEDNRIQNASVLFDTQHLRPLYQLHYGESSMSFALDIARQHGLEKSIINAAYRYLDQNLTPTEKLLQQIEKQKQLLHTKQQKLEQRMAEVFQLELSYKKKLKELEEKEKAYKEKQLEKLDKELNTLREEIQYLREAMKEKKLSVKELETMADTLEKKLHRQHKSLHKPLKVLSTGQDVYIPSFQASGKLEAIDRKKAKVRIGGISFIVSIDELYEAETPSSSASSSPTPTISHLEHSVVSIDVRGKTVDEALKQVVKTLDRAIRDGTHTITIIHGIGEGILQKAIHDFLKEQRCIEKYEFAPENQGGKGRTIVSLK